MQHSTLGWRTVIQPGFCRTCTHTVLLRSDGQAVACGINSDRQCSIPSSKSRSCRYTNDFKTFLVKVRVVQVDFLLEDDAGVILKCVGLDGQEVLRLNAQKSDRTVDVCSRVARELNTPVRNLRMILPDARLLGTISKANPLATLSDVMSAWAKMASIDSIVWLGNPRLSVWKKTTVAHEDQQKRKKET